MIPSLQMDWDKQFEEAFKPYPWFVEQVTKKLIEIDAVQTAAWAEVANQYDAFEKTRAQTNTLQLEADSAKSALADYQAKAETAQRIAAATLSATEAKLNALLSEPSETADASQVTALFSTIEELKQAVASANARADQMGLRVQEAEAHANKKLQDDLSAAITRTSELNAKLEPALAEVSTLRLRAERAEEALKSAQANLTRAEARARDAEEELSHYAHSSDAVAQVDVKILPTQRAARMAKSANLPERTVLLIDDAEINRVLTSHYFKGFPVKLEFALSVELAKQKCQNQRFDLILIDDELQSGESESLKSASPHLVAIQDLLGDRETRFDRLKSYLWSPTV